MGRPKKYETEQERQEAHRAAKRAYRRRQAEGTVPVSRAALEGLMAAIAAAAEAFDPVARQVQTGDADSLLRNLALLFRQRADVS
jgi:hypothetical protein